MTIIEAVKSGKAFRRKAWGWEVTWMIPGSFPFDLYIEDILATDWETIDE